MAFLHFPSTPLAFSSMLFLTFGGQLGIAHGPVGTCFQQLWRMSGIAHGFFVMLKMAHELLSHRAWNFDIRTF